MQRTEKFVYFKQGRLHESEIVTKATEDTHSNQPMGTHWGALKTGWYKIDTVEG